LPGLAIVGALLVVMSSTGGLGAWFSGVARIPYVIGIDRYLPPALGKAHPKWGTPHVALITQGVVATLLMIAAVTESTIEEAYIMLLDMAIILYFIPFLYMFAALPALRFKAAGNNAGVSLVPGGTPGMILCSALGFGATLLSVILAMLPPQGSSNPQMFVLKVGGGCLLFVAAGLIFYYRSVNSARAAPHDGLDGVLYVAPIGAIAFIRRGGAFITFHCCSRRTSLAFSERLTGMRLRCATSCGKDQRRNHDCRKPGLGTIFVERRLFHRVATLLIA
jgi:amino acid transporter